MDGAGTLLRPTGGGSVSTLAAAPWHRCCIPGAAGGIHMTITNEHGFGALGVTRTRGAPLSATTHTNVGDLERVGSVVAGGALLLLGSGKSLPTRAVLAAASGALVYRGVTGHCALYEALGVQRAPEERTHRELSVNELQLVQRSVTIGKPAAELYALWCRADTHSKIMKPFAEVQPVGDTGLRFHLPGPLGKSLDFEV